MPQLHHFLRAKWQACIQSALATHAPEGPFVSNHEYKKYLLTHYLFYNQIFHTQIFTAGPEQSQTLAATILPTAITALEQDLRIYYWNPASAVEDRQTLPSQLSAEAVDYALDRTLVLTRIMHSQWQANPELRQHTANTFISLKLPLKLFRQTKLKSANHDKKQTRVIQYDTDYLTKGFTTACTKSEKIAKL
tara:strand:+ start:43 stop:618 length:576 start_codon:yes stop_codon:yes gene_type:complete